MRLYQIQGFFLMTYTSHGNRSNFLLLLADFRKFHVYSWIFLETPNFSLTILLFLFPICSPLFKSPLSALRSHTSVVRQQSQCSLPHTDTLPPESRVVQPKTWARRITRTDSPESQLPELSVDCTDTRLRHLPLHARRSVEGQKSPQHARPGTTGARKAWGNPRREAIDACGAMDEVGRNREPLRRMGVDDLGLAYPPGAAPVLDPPEGTG